MIASQPVVQTATIKMTGAATPILDQVVLVAMQVAVAKTLVRVPEHRTEDVTTLALSRVELTIDVVTRNHRKGDVTTLVRRVVNQVAVPIALVRSLVDLTIAADSFRLTVAMAASWLHDTTAVASVGQATFDRRSADRVTIVVA